jgi:general secretion pathway protein G
MNTKEDMLHKKAGFTLIELMIVVIILASLAGMVLPRIMDRTDDARINIAKAEIAAIASALKFFRLDMGQYPTNEQGLQVLMKNPGSEGRGALGTWKGPYLEKEPEDPWGNDYHYRVDAGPAGFEVWSDGPPNAGAEGRISNLVP